METKIKLMFATHVRQSFWQTVPITEHQIFVLMDEGEDQNGKTLYGFRLGLPGACPWAFPKECTRELEPKERGLLVQS